MVVEMMKKRHRTTSWYLSHPRSFARDLSTFPESYWVNRGKRMALSLGTRVCNTVPAYKNFLRKLRCHPATPLTWKQFTGLPCTTKKEYLSVSPYSSLFFDGRLTDVPWTVAATSGSTGQPFYFPHGYEQERSYAALAEMYLRQNFSLHTRSTLFIIGWGMGIWIGGVFSYEALRLVAKRGPYRLSITTPGASKEDILSSVVRLGPLYDQVIIGGYPPMIKDLVDAGVSARVRWSDYHVGFIFSAEGFSEEFRQYIEEKTGIQDPYRGTLNHYGTVDLGTMAHETPLCILLRRLAKRNEKFQMALFGHPTRQGTLAQYIPELFYFESVGGSLVCTADGGIPLVRYDLLDTGSVFSYEQVRQFATSSGIDLDYEIRSARISDSVWNVPFVTVFERRDFTVKWYGANIYPQELRRALESTFLSSICSGKCVAIIGEDASFGQTMTVAVELQEGVRVKSAYKKAIRDAVTRELLESNSEYAYLVRTLSRDVMTPRIECYPYRSAPYFSVVGKHRWVSHNR